MAVKYEIKLGRRFKAAREAANGGFQLYHLLKVLDGVKNDLGTNSQAPLLQYNITSSFGDRNHIRMLSISMSSKTDPSRHDHIQVMVSSNGQPSVMGPRAYHDSNGNDESYILTPGSFADILGKAKGAMCSLAPEHRQRIEEAFKTNKEKAFHPCSTVRAIRGFCDPGAAVFQR